eukprot:1806886-Rhodomonas_salina.1
MPSPVAEQEVQAKVLEVRQHFAKMIRASGEQHEDAEEGGEEPALDKAEVFKALQSGVEASMPLVLGASVAELNKAVGAQVEDRRTFLMWAARYGLEPVVHALLLKGGEADVNEADREKQTALMMASANGFDSIVEMLLAHNARIDLKSNGNKNALHYAAEFAPDAAVLSLMQQRDTAPASSRAELNSAINQPETTKHLTPLHLAAKHQKPNMVRELLRGKADVNCRSLLYRTPLMLAASYHNDLSLFKDLLHSECKADIYAADARGVTALLEAA